jgi:hypothetical protein
MNLRKGFPISKCITIMLLIPFHLTAQIISDRGHPEHFLGGVLVGGITTHLVWKKTEARWKSWVYGVAVITAVAGLKEWVDPKWFNGTRSSEDFVYSALGGVAGATLTISLSKKKKRNHKPSKGLP